MDKTRRGASWCRKTPPSWSLRTGLFLLATMSMVSTSATAGSNPTPSVVPGFTLSTFASAPAGSTAPDSIAIVKNTVWVAFGNGGKPDGSDGAKSTIVEYSNKGAVLRSLTVVGHNDGLRLDPHTGKLWAMQNEDSDPNLVIINPASGSMENYTFGKTPHGGGYDDIAFRGNAIYLSASNPTADSSGNVAGPSIVEAKLEADHTVSVTPLLPGTPNAVDMVTGKAITLNLTDPDSLIFAPSGDLLLDDQGDAQLVLVHLSSPDKQKTRVLTLAGSVQVDDTIFATSHHGYLLVADRDANTIYRLDAPGWVRDIAYSASTGVAASTKAPITPAIPAYVGEVNFHTGAVTPVISNLVSPHGMAFVATQ
jgi:hypothetical protein